MSDTNARNAADASRINLSQDHEVRYWTEALDVSEDRLRQLVADHGNSATAVRAALDKSSA